MTTKNFVVKNGLTTGNINLYAGNSNVSANYVVANLSVPATANLGAVGNITITGGTTGQVLSTNGSGTLSWVDQSTGSSGGSLNIFIDTFTADGSANTYTLSTTPSSENFITVNLDGVTQLHGSYSLSGDVLTMAGVPVNGAILEVTSYGGSGPVAGSNTQVQFNDAGSLSASAALTFNKTSNTLNATNITANGAPVATTGKAIAMALVFGF